MTIPREACDGCGVCEKRCQVGAVSISAEKRPALVDLNLCIGCSLCVVPTCPKNAISLSKKKTELRLVQTWEELYDIIMAKKKGPLGKLKLTGKMFYDAFQTGRTDILKR